MTNEEIISGFMRKHYTDEKLAALLAHAEDEKLSFASCCCFIGVATADHALRGYGELIGVLDAEGRDHYDRAELLSNARLAESAYCELAPTDIWDDKQADRFRRAALIPLIRAEIERRERERSESPSPVDLQVVSV